MSTIGKRLRVLRLNRGMTQKYVASKLEISNVTYSQYERDERTPNDETKTKLATLFNVSVDYLINGKEEDTEEDKLIKLLIQKTLDKKIEWVSDIEISNISPMKIDDKYFSYEEIKYLVPINDETIFKRQYAFTKNNIFIFVTQSNNNNFIHSLYLWGNARLTVVTSDKYLERLFDAIYKPSKIIDISQIEDAITDLKNL